MAQSPTPLLPKWQKCSTTPQYSAGELGKLATSSACVLVKLGWTCFFNHHMRQVYRSVHPSISSVHHPAAPYLARLARHGVPAPSSAPPWPVLQQDAAANRGPHPSASRSYKHFILQDMFDYVHMGYWLVLPYLALRGHPSQKIAPSSVVPQRPPSYHGL